MIYSVSSAEMFKKEFEKYYNFTTDDWSFMNSDASGSWNEVNLKIWFNIIKNFLTRISEKGPKNASMIVGRKQRTTTVGMDGQLSLFLEEN